MLIQQHMPPGASWGKYMASFKRGRAGCRRRESKRAQTPRTSANCLPLESENNVLNHFYKYILVEIQPQPPIQQPPAIPPARLLPFLIMSLNSSFLASASASFDANSRYTLAMNAMTSQDPNHVLQKRQHSQEHHQHTYNVKVSNEFKITSQKSSGRCWIFACLNVMRNQMVKKYSLPDTFELSQTFCFFYDKLERCNYFLDQIIQTVSEPLDERLVQHLLSSPMNDGGQWEMLVNVVEKVRHACRGR